MTMHKTDAYTIESLLAERDWLAALASTLVADPQGADDVAQETWLAAVERPPRPGSGRGWLATVLRNRARDAQRRASRRTAREMRVARPEPTRSVADVAEQADTQRQVIAAVLALDEPYRSTVLLRYFEELDAASIAERMETTASTVRTRLARGLEQLRHALRAHHESEAAWRKALLPLSLPGGSLRSASTLVSATFTAWPLVGTLLAIAVIAAAVLLVWQPFAEEEAAHGGSEAPPRLADGSQASDGGASTGRPMLAGRDVGGGEPPAESGAAATHVALSDEDAQPPKPTTTALAVHVVDADGESVAEADVVLLDLSLSKYPVKAALVGQTKTDAQGRARFEKLLPKGNLQLRAAEGGRGVISRTYDGMDLPEEAVRLRLEPTLTVAGHVRGPEGNAVEGAIVALHAELPGGHEIVAVKKTPADGAFRMAGIPRSLIRSGTEPRSRIQVRAKGYVENWEGIAPDATELEQLELALTRARRATGRVVGVRGEPLGDVSLEFRDANGGGSTGKDGRFTAGGLPATAFRILFNSSTHAPREIEIAAGSERDIDLGDVELRPGRPIAGVVVDAQGEVMPGVHVAVADDALDQFIRQGATDEEGRFAFEHFGPGKHTVSVFTDSGGDTNRSDVEAGQTDLRIVVRQKPRLELAFVDSDAKALPIDAVAIRAHLVEDPEVKVARSHGSEGMTIRTLALPRTGRWHLTVRVTGYQEVVLEHVEVGDARPVPIKILLVPVGQR